MLGLYPSTHSSQASTHVAVCRCLSTEVATIFSHMIELSARMIVSGAPNPSLHYQRRRKRCRGRASKINTL